MAAFLNTISIFGLFLIFYAGLLHFFPPKYLNFWYGISTSATQKDSNKWNKGQKIFSYIIFGIGVSLILLGINTIKGIEHQFPIILWMLLFWKISILIVNHILKKGSLDQNI